MPEKRYPVAFRPYVGEVARGKGAQCAIEQVDGEHYYFKCSDDAKRFMDMHSLEPVTDMTLQRIRGCHPNAVVLAPLGGGAGTVVWDVYNKTVEVYPAVRATYRGTMAGYPEEIGFARQNLQPGKVYTVARVSIERSNTYIELLEKPGLRFSSVTFEYLVP